MVSTLILKDILAIKAKLEVDPITNSIGYKEKKNHVQDIFLIWDSTKTLSVTTVRTINKNLS